MRAWVGHVALVAGVVYVAALGWAMQRLSYDVWGAMIVGPLILVVSYPAIRRIFGRHDQRLVTIVLVGLLAKMAGSMVRYWVAFDAYGGASDAGRYHEYGRTLAGQIRSGEASLLRIIPTGTGTQFLERWTATVYTVFGSSRLAGFLLFGWMLTPILIGFPILWIIALIALIVMIWFTIKSLFGLLALLDGRAR